MAEKPSAGDAKAGQAVAERECKACHGLDGRGVAPAFRTWQRSAERYLLVALTEYRR
jgi:cytochrome c553